MNDRAFVAGLVLSVAVATAVMLTGCAAIQRSETRSTEHLLAAAGFELRPADTAEQQQHLAALPPFRLESHSTDGKVVYIYADPDGCHCLYVGGSKEYSKFQRLKASQIDGDIWEGPWRSGSAFPSARETGLPDLVISRTHGLEAMAPEGDRMRRVLEKSFLIMMVVGGLTALGKPASAYVAHVLTSIPVASSEGRELEDAVRTAINDVLEHAIAFVPTLVDVRDARVVGDRIYILLLLADDDGAAIVQRLTDGSADEL